jgi:hypothetical protein
VTDYPVVQRKRRPSTRSELANDTIKIKHFPLGKHLILATAEIKLQPTSYAVDGTPKWRRSECCLKD